MRSYRMGAMCLAAAFLATVLIGCSENNGKKPKIRRIEGVAKLIDLQNNVVSMTIKDDKGVEVVMTGTVREDTEVLINGRSQALKDVCVGDQVVVYGYKEVQGDNQKLIAQKVEVTRSRESDWKSTGTGDPAKQPVVKGSEPPTKATTPQPGPATTLPPTPKTTEKPADPSVPAAGPNREEAAAQLTDMIYARISIRMEEAIAKRTELLKAGRPRSDADVRKQEEIIMNARTRLIESGEVVPEINPPIVELAAPTPPPATPPGAKPAAPPSDKPATPPATPPGEKPLAPTPPPSKP